MTIESTLERIAVALEQINQNIYGFLTAEEIEILGNQVAEGSTPAITPEVVKPEDVKPKAKPRNKKQEVVIPAAAEATTPAPVKEAGVTLPVDPLASLIPDAPSVKHTTEEIRSIAIKYLTSLDIKLDTDARKAKLSEVLRVCGQKTFDAIDADHIEMVYDELVKVVA